MRVFLYAGQGAQFVGMGQDMYAAFPDYAHVVDSADPGFDHKKLMSEGPIEVLSDTVYTQPCYAIFAAGVTAVLKKHGIVPDAACGLSLGEYGALYAAGVWNTKDYIDIVTFRGRVMAEAVKGMVYSMSAIVGSEASVVEKVCAGVSADKGFVTVANYNCPGQYVICGVEEAVAAVEEIMTGEYKAKAKRLNTTSPFHTYLLKEAGDRLKEKFAAVQFNKAQIPVVMNVTGKMLTEEDDIKVLLEQQVQNSVRFEESLKLLIESGADEFIEIGPGKVLTGLVRKSARALGTAIKVSTIQKAEDLQKLIEENA